MDPQKLYTYRLTPKDVINVIQSQSQAVDRRPGRHAARVQGAGLPVHASNIQGQLTDPAAVREHRRQVAECATAAASCASRMSRRVELGAQTYAQDFRIDGKPAAGMAIYQLPGANALAVGRRRACQDGAS